VDIELVLNIILIIEFSTFSLLRIIFQLQARQAGFKTVIEEGKTYPIFLSIFICYEVFTFFLTASWFIGLTWTLGLSFAIALRVKKEESMMIEKFGDKYRIYMKSTGRFLPYF
jgi:hypothetical protein